MVEARDDLTSLDAGTLHRRLRERSTTAVELTRAFLNRIQSLDPALNAFVRINPCALDEAAAADRLLQSGRGVRLTGLPVAVKDNLATAGLETTCASRMLDDYVPLRDATVVARLRQAGAVVVGKTNMDEFGMGSSNENSAFGPVRNPWKLDRVPGGSSGGSAVAVAARLAPLALGSDTGGSVRQPAAFCGVVGLKPTYGRVSRSGLVAFGSSLDQVGPIATTVRDAAELLSCLAGRDADDMTTTAHPPDDYGAACERGVEGLVVGLPVEYFDPGLDEEIEQRMRDAASVLQRRGAVLREVSLPHTRYAIPTYYLVATAEASSNLARYDGVRYGTRVRAERGLREMYRATRGRGFGAEVRRRIMLGTYALSAGYYQQFYGKAMRARTLLRDDFAEVFRAGVDLLLVPATPTTAFRIGEKVDDPLRMYLSDIYTVTANLAGLPALVVPAGLSPEGLPIGAQLIGREFDEALLFRAGAAIERELGVGRPTDPPLENRSSMNGP